jgi:AbrB family looped-hinge helix DNA binding protein
MGEPAYTLELQPGGLLSLPAALREALHVKAGDRVIVRVLGDGHAELVTARAAVKAARGLYAERRGERSPVEELLEERRAEAGQE